MRLLTKLVLTSYKHNTHTQIHQLEASRGTCFHDSVRIYWLLVDKVEYTRLCILAFFFPFFSREASLFTAIAVGEGSIRCSLLGPTEYRLCSFVFLASEQNHISSCSALLRGGSATRNWLAVPIWLATGSNWLAVPIWGAFAGFKYTTTACIGCFSVLNHSSDSCCKLLQDYYLDATFIALFSYAKSWFGWI